MKVEVQLINEKGRSVPSKQRATMPVYRGNLRIHEARVPALGRITACAHLVSDKDGLEPPLLPVLTDAAVLYVHKGQMRIRGFEVVDGAQYGQTWDVKVA